jgi:hypothetical protein
MEQQNNNPTKRCLTPKELSALAEHMAQTANPAEAALLSEAIVRGFYGDRAH